MERSREIAESDWKLFRKLRALALERFCERALAEITRLTAGPSGTSHERYLAVYARLQEQDRELGRLFNDPRRSTAVHQLAGLRERDLLTADEYEQFSPELRTRVEGLLGQR